MEFKETTSTHAVSSEKQTSLIQHLIELRERILRCCFVVFICFLLLFFFATDLYSFIAYPLKAHLPDGATMIATEVASPFLTPFKLSMVSSFFLAIPYILHQMWAFISPGLYVHEKRMALPFLLLSVILFYLGMLFAYYVVFPLIFSFFTHAAPDGVVVMTDINHYFNFVVKMFFAFGMVFEIPIATVLAVKSGLATPASLALKRPYIIVACFVVGMLLTPPDVFSQSLLAIPMWLLFELGLLVSRYLS